MAFTFQINHNVKFRHDEQLLKKAEENRPRLFKKRRQPVRIVELVKDESKLRGCGTMESQKNLEKLSSYGLKREDAVILDFGEHCVGYFETDIHSVGSPMDAPLYLRLRFAEVPAELSGESSEYSGWLSRSWIQEEFVHIDELPVRLKLPRRYSFRYVELKVLDTSPKWSAVFSHPLVVTETSAEEKEEQYPQTDDGDLLKICQVSIKTLSECMQDVFEDGPKRDRRLWLGDLRLQALANYATYDNTKLVKRCMYLFAAMTTEEGKIPANVFVKPANLPDDTFLFDYSLFFISVLSDYIKVHPETEVLEDLYVTAKRQMDLALEQVSEQGELILTEDYPVFVDWSNEFNKDTAGQAIMIYTLRQFLHLAEIMEEPEEEKYKKALKRMKEYAVARLYDKKCRLFVSGPEQEYNIASQVWMVLAHVLSPQENKLVMERTVEELFPVKGIATPYMYHHITEALFEAGLKEKGIELMKNYWGKMLQLGADTYWEAFDPWQPDYSPYGNPIVSSYCHAWSCTPVYLIHKYL